MLIAILTVWFLVWIGVALVGAGIFGLAAMIAFPYTWNRIDIKDCLKMLAGGLILLGIIEAGLRILYGLSLTDLFVDFSKQLLSEFRS